MKILYICRVFTGLETSLASGVWAPTGVPTIYKVMEGLAESKHETNFVLTARGIGADYDTAWTNRDDMNVTLDGFPAQLRVLAGEHRYPNWFGRVRGPLTDRRHLREIRHLYHDIQPDLVYVDRAHARAGAFLARRDGAKVLFRVMGVYPSMWEALEGKRRAHRRERDAYHAPFAQVICTQDGSGGEYWMEQALADGVPRTMMLNGHARPNAPATESLQLAGIPNEQTVVLFVGRLEWNKGAEPFIDAMLALPATQAERTHAVIIGTGQQKDMLTERVRNAGAEGRITFIDRLPHSEIRAAHARADIYVSLNRLGQLSNANLEVMSDGHCMVIPEARPEQKIDLITRELIPDDAVLRIPTDERQIQALVEAIVELSNDPDRRTSMTANLKAAAGKFIPSWDDRIAEEIGMLEMAAGCPADRVEA